MILHDTRRRPGTQPSRPTSRLTMSHDEVYLIHFLGDGDATRQLEYSRTV